jgi:hypothetical protein
MSAAINAEFTSIKEKLADADVDEATLVKVAALIAGKYDLVPRGQGLASSIQPSARVKPKTRSQMQDEEIERELLEEYPHLKSLPEEERRQEIFALRAEAEREFGLSKGDMTVAKTAKGAGAGTSEFAAAMAGLMPPDPTSLVDLDGGASDPLTAQRMAKLAALKDSPNLNRFRRSDG